MGRFFALMGLIGGLLHVLCSYTDGMEHLAWVQSVYMTLDLMLMLAVVGLWRAQGERWGLLGQMGFVLAACGLGVISGQNGQLYGVKIYEVGSPVLALGMVLVSLAVAPQFMAQMAGVLFGLAFMVQARPRTFRA